MGKVTAMSLADLYANPPAAMPDLWGAGWVVHPSLVILAAEQKVGKTLFAMQLLQSLIDPRVGQFLGQRVATVNRVLYLNEEVPQSMVFNRATIMWKRETQTPVACEDWTENYIIPPERGVKFDADPRLFYEIVQETKADVICVDPLGRYHSWDENSNHHMGMLMERFELVCKHLGKTVILVHHLAKGQVGDTRSPITRIRGAGRLIGDPDSIFTLQKWEGGKFVLQAELRHGEWPGDLILTRGKDLLYRVDDGTPVEEGMQAILALIADGPTPEELSARARDKGIDQPLRTVAWMLARGKLRQDGGRICHP